VVIDKMAGMPTAALSPEDRQSLANALVARYPEVAFVGGQPLAAGLLQRLDNETSGLLLAARTESAFAAMKARLDAGEVEKVYLALVAGEPPASGAIDKPIAHHPQDERRMVVVQGKQTATRSRARAALTIFRVLARPAGHALLEVIITRGVRHQIRLHLADAGFPVAGDALYGAPAGRPAPRHFLHASRLTFVEPEVEQRRVVESPLPEELATWLERLG
jgi:23S rRNA pseudouridine1911/1915/1917 synthase